MPPTAGRNPDPSLARSHTSPHYQLQRHIQQPAMRQESTASRYVNQNVDVRSQAQQNSHPYDREEPPTMFEKMQTEEMLDSKANKRMVAEKEQRLKELERIHGDLEARLEKETKGRQQLEHAFEARERQWNDDLQQVKIERDNFKKLVEAEELKNSSMLEDMGKKDQFIHQMMKQKYDKKDPVRPVRPVRTTERGDRTSTSSSKSPDLRFGSTSSLNNAADASHKGPQEVLEKIGSVEELRVQNTTFLLLDFFGM